MAIWSALPFSNETALDFVAGVSKKRGDAILRSLAGVFDEVMAQNSPLMTNRPVRVLIEPENVEALVLQLGSLEAATLACGAVEYEGNLWIEDNATALCKQAFAACALLALATSGNAIGKHDFGEPPSDIARILKVLTGASLSPLILSAREFCRALRGASDILGSWFGAENYPTALDELQQEVQKLLSHLNRIPD